MPCFELLTLFCFIERKKKDLGVYELNVDDANSVHNTIIVVNVLWKAAGLTTTPPTPVLHVLWIVFFILLHLL